MFILGYFRKREGHFKLILDDESSLLINVYKLCDNKKEDASYHEYVDVLNEIEQMLHAINPSFVICGGDFNIDILRNTFHSLKPLSFVGDFNMSLAIESDIADVPHTFICNAIGATSNIGYLVVSDDIFCQAISI